MTVGVPLAGWDNYERSRPLQQYRDTILASSDLFTVADDLTPEIAAPQWSPDGRWIAFAHFDKFVIASSQPPSRSWPLGTLDHSRGFLSLSWRPRTEP